MTAEQIKAALGEHQHVWDDGLGRCLCGWRYASHEVTTERDVRAHVAEVIAALMPEASAVSGDNVDALWAKVEQVATDLADKRSGMLDAADSWEDIEDRERAESLRHAARGLLDHERPLREAVNGWRRAETIPDNAPTDWTEVQP